MLETMQFFKPEESDKIPEKAGIYAFLYNPFDRSRLGLLGKKASCGQRIKEARITLKRKLLRLSSLRDGSAVSGSFVVQGLYGQPSHLFNGSFPRSEETPPWDALDMLTDKAFNEYIGMAEKSYFILPALYCGMTVRQGLKKRYIQHFNNYESDTAGTFGGRLSKLKISWSDIRMACIPLTAPSDESESIRTLEKHLIFLLGPALSER